MNRAVQAAGLETVKIGLSVLVAFALAYPFLQPEPVGLAKELALLGMDGAVAVGAVFFFLVVLYANDLRLLLTLLPAGSRAARPGSVWWMLVLPYNFIEDFFIIHAVTASLRAEALVNPRLKALKSFGAWSGFGWCAAQIGSLIPNQAGSVFALVAFVLWLVHWHWLRQAKGVLRGA